MQNSIQRTMLAVVAVVLVLIAGIWWGGTHPICRHSCVTRSSRIQMDRRRRGARRYRAQLPPPPARPRSYRTTRSPAAIDGLGDPYAAYQTPAEFRDFGKAVRSGAFLRRRHQRPRARAGLLVESVIAGTPAAAAASSRGRDRCSQRQVVCRPPVVIFDRPDPGQSGTTVTLTIDRGKRRLTLALKRAKITASATPLVVGRLVSSTHEGRLIELVTFDVAGIHTRWQTRCGGCSGAALKRCPRPAGQRWRARDVRHSSSRASSSPWCDRHDAAGRPQPNATLYAT